MSIIIYHGDNGGYKSASAVQDEIVPELKKGRTVVTNIRGCNLERIMSVYPEIPDEAELINVDMNERGAYDRLRRWFRWAPKGALIVLDEVQLIHKSEWRTKELEQFILEVQDEDGNKRRATEEEAEQLDEPYNMLDAFTRHRHFNWDIVMTTPSLAYLRNDIQETAQTAYFQVNASAIGVKGKFKRSVHSARRNMPRAGDQVTFPRIKQETFACYESTATGKVQDNRGGLPIWKNPKILFLLVLLACIFGRLFYLINSNGNPVAPSKQVEKSIDVGSQANRQNIIQNTVSNNNDDSDISRAQVANSIVSNVSDMLDGYDLALSYYGSGVRKNYQLTMSNQQGQFVTNINDLKKLGYQVLIVSECLIVLEFHGNTRPVHCFDEYYKDNVDNKADSDAA